MPKFLHTSDWQLGITRHFLDAGVAERYTHDRFERIRRMGELAQREDCCFMVVCGDVFEANEVSLKTVRRACEALAEVPVPVYLLPGNHDPLVETSVYRGKFFSGDKLPNVTVLEDERPVQTAEGLELVAAPWRAKRLAENPLHPVLRALAPAEGMLRVVVAHGEVDELAPMSDSSTRLSLSAMREAIQEGKAHYIALGDKHSLTQVDGEGRIWYSGTPEATAFRETNPGHVAIVSLEHGAVEVKPVHVGTWTFREIECDSIMNDADARELIEALSALPDKERCVLRLRLGGLLGLPETTALREGLAEARDLFASFECDMSSLHTGIDIHDIDASGLTGFARAAALRLKERVDAGGTDAGTARDALMLLTLLNRTGLDSQ